MNLTSDDLLGKEIVDPDGEILGVTMKLHLDANARKILGLTVDQGMWKPDLFIGIDYVDKLGKDAIFLNNIPYSKLKGIKVYSYDGKKIGRVSKVHWDVEGYTRLEVAKRSSKFPWRTTSTTLSPKDVQEIGHSIILKPGKQFRID